MPKFNYQSFIKYIFSIFGDNNGLCFFIVREDLVVCGTLNGKLCIWNNTTPMCYNSIRYGNQTETDDKLKLVLLTNAITHYNNFDISAFISHYEYYITNGKPHDIVMEQSTYFQIPKQFAIS